MSKGRIIRKFERMLNVNNITEVRPDSGGALRDEVKMSEERNPRKKYFNYKEKEQKMIGYHTFNFETGEIKYTPCKK